MRHLFAVAAATTCALLMGAMAQAADPGAPASAPPSNQSGHGSAMDIQKPGSNPARGSGGGAESTTRRPAISPNPSALTIPPEVGSVPPPSDRAGHGSAMDIQKPGSNPAR